MKAHKGAGECDSDKKNKGWRKKDNEKETKSSLCTRQLHKGVTYIHLRKFETGQEKLIFQVRGMRQFFQESKWGHAQSNGSVYQTPRATYFSYFGKTYKSTGFDFNILQI